MHRFDHHQWLGNGMFLATQQHNLQITFQSLLSIEVVCKSLFSIDTVTPIGRLGHSKRL
jgi:hypothetical protein